MHEDEVAQTIVPARCGIATRELGYTLKNEHWHTISVAGGNREQKNHAAAVYHGNSGCSVMVSRLEQKHLPDPASE